MYRERPWYAKAGIARSPFFVSWPEGGERRAAPPRRCHHRAQRRRPAPDALRRRARAAAARLRYVPGYVPDGEDVTLALRGVPVGSNALGLV